MKKNLITATLLLSPILALAGMPDTTPTKHGSFYAGFTLGAFKQSDIGTSYGIDDSNTDINGIPESPLLRANNKYGFGWGVHGGYLFSNNNNVTFSFMRFDDDTSKHLYPNNHHIDTSLVPPQWAMTAASSVSDKYKYDTNIYHINFGHWFKFPSSSFMINPFFGVGIANFDTTQTTTYLGIKNPAPLLNSQATVKTTSDLCGAGPLAGFNFTWNIWHGFSFGGNITYNLLVSELKHSYFATTSVAGVEAYLTNANIHGKAASTVVNFISAEAHIGYKLILAHRKSEIVLGYYANDFVNARIKTRLVDNLTPIVTTASESTGFHGFFFRVTVFI